MWFVDYQGQIVGTDWPRLKHPGGLLMPQFSDPPTRLCVPPQFSPPAMNVRIWRRGPKDDQLRETAAQLGARAMGVNVDIICFVRLLAKIAHGLAVATLSSGSFRPYLPGLILGRSQQWTPFVGGDFIDRPPTKGRHYVSLNVYDVLGRSILGCYIRLFGQLGAPTHLVAVGEMTTSDELLLRADKTEK